MSIFSRKSKSNQPQAVNGKQNGQAYPRGSKNANSTSTPNGYIVDPIVQRMAMQAASRRRMNSETPDYSIQSAPSGHSITNNGNGVSAPSPAARERRSSRAYQSNDLAKTASADYGRPVEAVNPQKQIRDSNKFRKSSATMSPQSIHAPFSNGTDPDTQKMRMPEGERGQPSPQVSRDSGYASVAHSATMDSRTLSEFNTPQETELLRRPRKVNASLPRDDEAAKGRSFSLPASQVPLMTTKPRDVPSTHKTVEKERRDSSIYVSRLDPGSDSSSFMSTSVVPQASKPKPTEASSKLAAPQKTEKRESQITQTGQEEPVKPLQEKAQRRESESWRRSDGQKKAATYTSCARDSQPPPAKLEQPAKPIVQTVDRSVSKPPHKNFEEPVKPAQQTRMGQSSVSRLSDPKEDNINIMKSTAPSRSRTWLNSDRPQIPPLEELQSKATQPLSTPTTPYQTPKESLTPFSRSPKTSSPPRPRPPEPETRVVESDKLISPSPNMRNQESQIAPPEETSTPPPAAPTRSSAEPPVVSSSIDNKSRLQMRFPSPAPQTEFPYLDGIEKGATFSSPSVLEGYKVNRRGHILDEEGDIIGELVQGEIIHCVRRKVNAQGEVVDESGNVVGQARPLPQGPISPMMYQRQDGSRSEFYIESLRSPISPATTYDRQDSNSTYHTPHQSQQSNGTAERALSTSDSGGNTVYFELDASVESQAVPMIDHSEIFIPPFGGSQWQSNSRSATSLTETGRRAKRRQSNRSHTSRASQERNILDGKQNSRKWISSYYEARTGNDIGSVPKTGKGQAEQPRSYSMVSSNAPKAVLGLTWESLLDTVPDRSQTLKAPIANGSVAQLGPHGSVRTLAPTGGQPEAASSTQPSAAEDNVAAGAIAARSRRASQAAINQRGSIRRPFAKSPLGSGGMVLESVVKEEPDTDEVAANTPPGSAWGQPDGSFERQFAAPTMGGMQTTSTQDRTGQVAEEEDDDAAPAPTVMKKVTAKSTKSAKSGAKRKSFFGIPIGKKEQVVTAQ